MNPVNLLLFGYTFTTTLGQETQVIDNFTTSSNFTISNTCYSVHGLQIGQNNRNNHCLIFKRWYTQMNKCDEQPLDWIQKDNLTRIFKIKTFNFTEQEHILNKICITKKDKYIPTNIDKIKINKTTIDNVDYELVYFIFIL